MDKRPQRQSALLISKHVQPLLKGDSDSALPPREENIYTYIIWNSSTREICFFSPFIQSFISIWAHNLILCHLLFTLFWLLVFFQISSYMPLPCPSFFEHFLTFNTTGSFKLILYFPRPSPRLSHFSKEPWFLLLDNGI